MMTRSNVRKPVYSREGTVLIQSLWNFVKMLIPIKPRSGLKLRHVGSKTGLLGQTLEKHCAHSRGHSLEPEVMKLCQNVNSRNI